MNFKKLIPFLLVGILICFIIVLSAKINDKRAAAQTYGAEFFNGLIPDNHLTILKEFGTKNNSIHRTVLVLFDPECEACYSQIQNILYNREMLNTSHIILASSIPEDQILAYMQKFNFAEFNMVSVCELNSQALEKSAISYPTIIIYDSSGEYVKGFRGNVKFEQITDIM